MVSRIAARNWAVFLAIYEIVSILRHFVLGHAFTDITPFFGPAPQQQLQIFFWCLITCLAAAKFAFAANSGDPRWAQVNASVAILELPLFFAFMFYNHGSVIFSGTSPHLWTDKLARKAVFVMAICVASAYFFYVYADSVYEVTAKQETNSRSAAASVSSSSEREPTPVKKRASSAKGKKAATPKRSTSRKTA